MFGNLSWQYNDDNDQVSGCRSNRCTVEKIKLILSLGIFSRTRAEKKKIAKLTDCCGKTLQNPTCFDFFCLGCSPGIWICLGYLDSRLHKQARTGRRYRGRRVEEVVPCSIQLYVQAIRTGNTVTVKLIDWNFIKKIFHIIYMNRYYMLENKKIKSF